MLTKTPAKQNRVIKINDRPRPHISFAKFHVNRKCERVVILLSKYNMCIRFKLSSA